MQYFLFIVLMMFIFPFEVTAEMDGREQVLYDYAIEYAQSGKHLFYVKIPGNIGPMERGYKFEDPLHLKLQKANLGEVAGGGSQLAEGGGIEFCGLDVVVNNKEKGLQLIVETMKKLEAPKGTIVEEYFPKRINHDVWQE